MRNRIFGAIGVIWGGGVLLSYFIGARGAEGSNSYTGGQVTGLIFGGLLSVAGLFYLVKGSKK